MFGYKVYAFGEYYIVVILKILKVWPSCIAGKRSFVAFTIYQMSRPTLFLVAQVYLIFYHDISQIYLNCTFCVRWGVLHTPTPPRSLRPCMHATHMSSSSVASRRFSPAMQIFLCSLTGKTIHF